MLQVLVIVISIVFTAVAVLNEKAKDKTWDKI